MEDLLNEDDFISKKVHSPWKRFSRFYIIAVIQAIVLYIAYLTTGNESLFTLLLFLLYIISPLILPFLMILLKKENIFLPKRIITLSIFLLTTIYTLNYFLINLLDFTFDKNQEAEFETALGFAVMFFMSFVLCSIIILVITSVKSRRFYIAHLPKKS